MTEELVTALLGTKSYEFKALFDVIQVSLRSKNVTGGGSEMLRLRAYEKLQNLVQQGQVSRTGKEYKGIPKPLRQLAKQLEEYRKNGRPSPGQTGTPLKGADTKAK